jgi:hypothetical protein
MATMDQWTRWLVHGESRREPCLHRAHPVHPPSLKLRRTTVALAKVVVVTVRTYRVHGVARPRLHTTITTITTITKKTTQTK